MAKSGRALAIDRIGGARVAPIDVSRDRRGEVAAGGEPMRPRRSRVTPKSAACART
jgi:hypothetical protein